jgi:hypothetical protein
MAGRGTMGYPVVTNWWPESGLGGADEGGTAEPRLGGRRGRNASEGTARPGQQAVGQALACV